MLRLGDDDLHPLQDLLLLDPLRVGLDCFGQLTEIHPRMIDATKLNFFEWSNGTVWMDDVRPGYNVRSVLRLDAVHQLKRVAKEILQAPVVIEIDKGDILENALDFLRLSTGSKDLHEFHEPRVPDSRDIQLVVDVRRVYVEFAATLRV